MSSSRSQSQPDPPANRSAPHQIPRNFNTTTPARPHDRAPSPRSSPPNCPPIESRLRPRLEHIHTATMSFRPGARIFSSFRPLFRQPLLRRRVGTSAAPEEGGFAKFWSSPVGPKTVHFWYVCSSSSAPLYCTMRRRAHRISKPPRSVDLSPPPRIQKKRNKG
jgi:hypothetical protein